MSDRRARRIPPITANPKMQVIVNKRTKGEAALEAAVYSGAFFLIALLFLTVIVSGGIR